MNRARTRPTTRLDRATFQVSRAMEYFSEKELQRQIGQGKDWWPVALIKELIDNGLDACEMHDIAPEIEVVIGEDYFSVQDNGPGLPAEVIEGSLDFLQRVSDKALYVSPTRGQLGNALKALWAAPYVAHGAGCVVIETGGRQHAVEVSLDEVAQQPNVQHTVEEEGQFVKNGTLIKVSWPDSGCLLVPEELDSYGSPMAEDVVKGFAAFNPHATFRIFDEVSWLTDTPDEPFRPLDPSCEYRKWRGGNPTSPHWYTPETLRSLIAGYIAREREGGRPRTVREFVAEFRGLSSTAKQKKVTEDFSRVQLADLVEDGQFDDGAVARLLSRMQEYSKPVKPAALGVIGQEHMTSWTQVHGGTDPDTVRYAKRVGVQDGLPFVIEIAFGVRDDDDAGRCVHYGLNWTPALGSPPVKELNGLLQEMRVDPHDPVTLLFHMVCPRFDFIDHGKGVVAPMAGSMNDALEKAVHSVCRDWKRLKRKADRQDRVEQEHLDQYRRSRKARRATIREIAFDVMEAAYQKASGNGRYPATARQIYYAARPEILARHPDIDKLDSPYFTGTLLKDYLEEWEPDWDVVWDARGHFEEPHTRRDKVGLGGIEVRKYLNSRRRGFEIETPELSTWDELIPTRGPNLRYGGVLFIEKEGFSPLLKAGQIAEKFDLAIMSTKGMPVSAACDLLGPLGLPVFVVRDFDKAGFSIVNSLRTGTRGSKDHPEEVIDLGLRLDDIAGLEREAVTYNQDSDPGLNLDDNGATEEEIEILVSGGYPGHWTGERVELNAMTADQFLAWLEEKLIAAGARKVEPEADVLTAAYHRAAFLQNAEERFREMCKTYDPSRTGPPYLSENVRCLLEETPTLSWDEVIWRLAREDRWNEHPET